VVTTREGGHSRAPYDTRNLGAQVGDDAETVAVNRAELAAALGIAPGRVVWMSQVHGREVAVVDGPATQPIEGVDALVTRQPGLALAVLVADCVPVLLVDTRAGVVGAAHAGRTGTAAGVATATVAAMTRLGARPQQLDVLLGPAICGACYEVPPQLQAEVEAEVPGSATATRAGTTGLDLRAGLARQLAAVGVRTVVSDPRCTAEDPTLFSFRRDGVTGRFAGLAWLDATAR